MNIQNVDDLKKLLTESLKKLEGVDGSLPVDGVCRVDVRVNNQDGFDISFEGEKDTTPNFVFVDVKLKHN